MESKLEAYRSKKRKALEDKAKNERYWNLLTLAPLRQRIFGNANNQAADNNVSSPTIFINAVCFQISISLCSYKYHTSSVLNISKNQYNRIRAT